MYNSGFNLDVSPSVFRNSTNISFCIGQSAESAELNIYDITGRVVKGFDRTTMQPFKQVRWFGENNSGVKLPAGIYFIQLKTDESSATRKVVYLR